MINPNDELALIRIINFSRVGIGETRINNIAKSAFEKKISFYDELENMENEKIQNFVNQINNIKDTCFNLTVSKALTKIVEMSFYHDFLMNEYEINDAKERIENVNELIVTATEKEKQMKEDVSISEFLAEISLYITANDSINENNKDYISLMTIHHAKGLEFKVVFVVGMVDGIFPSSNAENYEEERRLAYVAITRAKERLYLCGYKEILGYLKSR
jgi:DNA helicase-2/ATP-dependent DNA helicase PcrA